jgi:hypothetical protein
VKDRRGGGGVVDGLKNQSGNAKEGGGRWGKESE